MVHNFYHKILTHYRLHYRQLLCRYIRFVHPCYLCILHTHDFIVQYYVEKQKERKRTIKIISCRVIEVRNGKSATSTES